MSNIKELAKELCEESTCHHKCPTTDDCIVEDEALLLINENKSNNFDVKSNNEIEEMTKTLHEGMKPLKETYGANELASILYHAGYRKQSEGEWIAKDNIKGRCSIATCSNCGTEKAFSILVSIETVATLCRMN